MDAGRCIYKLTSLDANVKTATLGVAEVCGGLQFPLATAVSLA